MGHQTKNVEDLADSFLRQIKSKYTKAKINLKKPIASPIAPGQCDILKNIYHKMMKKMKLFPKRYRQWLTCINIMTKYVKQ